MYSFLGCDCDNAGSNGTSCHTNGKCICKSGYTGDKCDICLPGYYQEINGTCQGMIFISNFTLFI